MKKLLVLLFISAFVFGCQKAPDPKMGPDPSLIPKPKPTSPVSGDGSPASGDNSSGDQTRADELRVSVMAYNMENLFDDVKDGNEDVIPSADLEKKLANLSSSVLQVNGGRGPDVLMVEEVENRRVLQMLNAHMAAAGYGTIELIESNDERGIDVGVFSRFPLAGKSALHQMPFSDMNPTRGIMEVPLALPNGKVLRAFAFHFPSQANPVVQRHQAAAYLQDLMNAVDPGQYAVAAGDSNVTGAEEEKQSIFHGVFADFQVSHLIGCGDCGGGSYFYRKHWDFLDAIIARGEILDPASIQLPHHASGQLLPNGAPQRFNAKTGAGMSDHLPVYGELLLH